MKTYREFWPFYVAEHSNATSRKLHFIGTTLVIVMAVLGATICRWFFVAMPICGYAFAWVGHFFFEKNRPATFKYPVWSLFSDFKMFALTLSGRMPEELRKYGKKPAVNPSA